MKNVKKTKMKLGCVEFCLPGVNLEEKLKIAEKRDLWVELVNSKERELDILDSFDVEINSVQAYLLHDFSILSKNPKAQRMALKHVNETIELAWDINAKYVVTVATYGRPEISEPFKRCVEVFRTLSKSASNFGITLLIEALSPERTSFLPSLTGVHGLVKEIGEENVALMADTCHINDSGEDVIRTLEEFCSEIVEVHLRGTGSKPPGKGDIKFREVLRTFKGPLMCLEYKSIDPEKDLEEALFYLGHL